MFIVQYMCLVRLTDNGQLSCDMGLFGWLETYMVRYITQIYPFIVKNVFKYFVVSLLPSCLPLPGTFVVIGVCQALCFLEWRSEGACHHTSTRNMAGWMAGRGLDLAARVRGSRKGYMGMNEVLDWGWD